jgi:hypothetical protein
MRSSRSSASCSRRLRVYMLRAARRLIAAAPPPSRLNLKGRPERNGFIMLMSAMGVPQVIVCASFHDVHRVRIVSSCAPHDIPVSVPGPIPPSSTPAPRPGNFHPALTELLHRAGHCLCPPSEITDTVSSVEWLWDGLGGLRALAARRGAPGVPSAIDVAAGAERLGAAGAERLWAPLYTISASGGG